MSDSTSQSISQAKCMAAPWHGPHTNNASTESTSQSTSQSLSHSIKVFNSLTNQLEELIPIKPNQLSWYICGPTVYDSAHLGHARAYLTFDLLRRTLQDYFGFQLKYVMNITDLDDKIILRARKNYLFDRFVKETVTSSTTQSTNQLIERIRGLYQQCINDFDASLVELKQAVPQLAGRAKADMVEKIGNEEIKRSNVQKDFDAFTQSISQSVPVETLLKSNQSILADDLDRQMGSTVTDHSIFAAHSQRYEREFLDDMTALGVRVPSVMTRVTEYIPQIIDIIKSIMDRGIAYQTADGSVYFSVDAFKAAGHHYAKLTTFQSTDASSADSANDTVNVALADGEGSLSVSSGKRDVKDFALWKCSKPGEPAWPSPWSDGRPGWHIECSAMGGHAIGHQMDIHSGGSDLKFPHHDNEMAQSEAAFGCQQWVNHFWHAGTLRIEGLKMSKSLKNFKTIRATLESYTARQVRLFFLLCHWDKSISFSEAGLDEAKSKEQEINQFFLHTSVYLRTHSDLTADPQTLIEADQIILDHLTRAQSTVHDALCNNFNFPDAMNALLSLISAANKYRALPQAKALTLLSISQYVDRMMRVFGVRKDDEPGFVEASSDDQSITVINAMCAFRDEIRNMAKQLYNKPEAAQAMLDLCDRFRDDTCTELGIKLEDNVATGSATWARENVETLKRQRAEAASKRRADALKKKADKKTRLQTQLQQLEQGQISPQSYYATLINQYSEFDTAGKPTKDAAGAELSKGAKKAIDKEWTRREKLFNDTKAKLTTNPQLIDEINKQIKELDEE